MIVMSKEKSMAERLLEQCQKESGWHTSRSDSNVHLTIKNAEGKVTGHFYKDGAISGVNNGELSGGLPWLLKK